MRTARRRDRAGQRIVEQDHQAVAEKAFERAFVFVDELAEDA